MRPLAKFFAEKYSRKHGCTRELHPQLIRELEANSWPGNVRELQGVIENMVMTTSIEGVGPESFRAYLEEKLSPTAVGNNEPKANLKLVIDSVQSEQIIATLKKVRTVGEAASALKTARTEKNRAPCSRESCDDIDLGTFRKTLPILGEADRP